MWLVLWLLCLCIQIENVYPASMMSECQEEDNCRSVKRAEKSRAGYVDDDASDVIHIIEPPQHFQKLKMIINQMGGNNGQTVYEHHMQTSTRTKVHRPILKVVPPPLSPLLPMSTTTTTTMRTIMSNNRQMVKNKNNPRNNRYNANNSENSNLKSMKVRANGSIEQQTTSIKATTTAMATTTTTTTVNPMNGKLVHQTKTKVRQHVRTTGNERRNSQQQQSNRQQQQQQQRRNNNSNNNNNVNNKPINLKIPNIRIHDKGSNRGGMSSSKVNELDLLTEDTQMAAVHAEQPPAGGLPLGILASLRKTERILHKKKIRPVSAHRHKTQHTQTFLMQQGYERANYEHGQDQQLAAEKVNYHNNKSRVKRAVVQPSAAVTANLTQALYIVKHISELLANAARYLPNDNDNDLTTNNNKETTHNSTTTTTTIKPPKIENNATKLARELGAELREQTQPKPLIGEIEPYEHANSLNNLASNELSGGTKLYEFLENSVNFTDAILTDLMERQEMHVNCKLSRDFVADKLSQRVRNLQHKVLCMQQQQQKQQQLKLKKVNPRPFPGSIPVRLSRQLAKYDGKALQKARELHAKKYDSDVRTHALLYNDVMSNIRNMLQSRVAVGGETAEARSHVYTVKPTGTAAVSDGKLNFHDFNDLNNYINRLGDVVENLPYPLNNHNNNYNSNYNNIINYAKKSKQFNYEQRDDDNEKVLWFRIDNDGHIVQEHINEPLDSLASHTSIFHRFPDIPGARVFNLPTAATLITENFSQN